jgi:hypothetical protein
MTEPHQPIGDPDGQTKPKHQPEMDWATQILGALTSPEGQAAMGTGAWLTDRDLVQFLLDYANQGRISRKRWASWVTGADLPGDDDASVGLGEEGQASLREWLTEIVEDLPAARQSQAAKWASAINGRFVMVPRLGTRGGSSGLTYRVIAPLGIAIGYAFALLLDPTKKLGEDLCRCKYSKCGKFFFVERKPGQRRVRRLSCSPEHGGLMDAEDAANRMARMRRARKHK